MESKVPDEWFCNRSQAYLVENWPFALSTQEMESEKGVRGKIWIETSGGGFLWNILLEYLIGTHPTSSHCSHPNNCYFLIRPVHLWVQKFTWCPHLWLYRPLPSSPNGHAFFPQYHPTKNLYHTCPYPQHCK